jgi:hypothetical protein
MIRIDTFKGVFSNGDPEDIPKEALTRLRNLRAVNGRLEKTFGYGEKLNAAVAEAMQGIWTFIHPDLTGGELYLAYGVTSSGYVRLYYWNDGSMVWSLISAHPRFKTNDVYYARIARNPIFQYDQVLRILPGNVGLVSMAFTITAIDTSGESFSIDGDYRAYFSVGQTFRVVGSTNNDSNNWVVSGTAYAGGKTVISVTGNVVTSASLGDLRIFDTAQGMWIGYIDRARWDGIVAASAGFYIYPTNLAAPDDVTITSSMIEIGGDNASIFYDKVVLPYGGEYNKSQYRFYKFSYVYDGIQESMMTAEPHVCDMGSDGNYFPKFTFTLAQSLNPRITGMRVYRATDFDGIYYRIHTINFLRETGEVESGSGAGGYAPVAAGAYDGQAAIYIPALSTYNFPNEVGYRYKFNAGGVAYTFYTNAVTGEGNTVFSLYGAGELTVDHWDASWELTVSTDGGSTYNPVDPPQSGSSGAFCGPHVVIVNSALTGVNDCAGGVFAFDSTVLRRITKNYMRAFAFIGDVLGTEYQACSWKILSPSKGLYTFADGGSSDIDVEFFDTGIADGEEGPYGRDEASILIHGKYARMINGMLWQADLILAPGTTKEETHPDWVSYSLPGCPDANPVSRVRRITDSLGSAVTGVYELLGMPVITHERAVIMVNTRSNPNDPATWYDQEASHAIGNLAEQGGIEAKGRLYVCSIDGIYGLAPNNFAESDRTPLESLRVSEPINDVYLALTYSQKQAIKAEFDTKYAEIVFTLGSAVWRYNVDRDEWREETTARTIGAMCQDEEGNVLIYDSSDKIICSSGIAESVAPVMRTKVFDISLPGGYEGLLRYLWLMFKSTENITALVLDAENTPSGSIEYGATYYVDGYTSVTYNGVAYGYGQAGGETFTGALGKRTYSVSGTGRVCLATSITFTAQTVEKLADSAPKFRARRVLIQLSASASTNAVQISGIKGE